MSEFNELLDLIDEATERDSDHISATEASNKFDQNFNCQEENQEENTCQIEYNCGKPFDVKLFAEEIRKKSEEENKIRQFNSDTISGYSIGHECIGATVLKIQNYPIKNFSHKWLPIVMRAALGNAVHDTIQKNTKQFTEQERSLKVPSIRCSVRLDCLSSNNLLAEIKSCTYSDYQKILKTKTPRITDFYQCLMYKYLIENHLEEIKNQKKLRSPPPQMDYYNIDTLQFIYVAHDILSSDAESFAECLKIVKQVKQMLKSRYNKFFFITALTIDLTKIDIQPYIDFIKAKIDRINWYVDNNKIPTQEDEFVDTGKCFFCLYNDTCPIKNT